MILWDVWWDSLRELIQLVIEMTKQYHPSILIYASRVDLAFYQYGRFAACMKIVNI